MPYLYRTTAAGGGGTPDNDDWIEVDLTDGTYTYSDPSSVLSGISNTDGLNSVTIGTTTTDTIVNGGIHWKELLNNDGTSYDTSDSPIGIEVYFWWPSTGWRTKNNTYNGGLNRPAIGSRCYTAAGVMGDPEHLPTSPGETEWPRDIVACGLKSDTGLTRHQMVGCKNTSTAGTRGTITPFSANLNEILESEYLADGYKYMNRLTWWARIHKADWKSATGIQPAAPPLINTLTWNKHYDNGDRRQGDVSYNLSQYWGRGNSDNKLYFFVSCGRRSGAASSATIDFRCFYKIHRLDSGNHPAGRTGL